MGSVTDTANTAWMRHLETVRWFGGKGAGARLVHRDAVATHTPAGVVPAVRSEVATLAHPDGRTEHYHLLVAHYAGEAPEGTVTLGSEVVDGVEVTLVDATTDPAAVRAFVTATQPAFAEHPVAVWGGEQSNTTLTLGRSDLYKLFRKVEPGPNLDAEVLLALGGGTVPALRGRLAADWPTGTSTDLGMVIERVQGARDGWELASAACASGEDFSGPARTLGAALRDVHTRMADAFGTEQVAGDVVADTMSARLDAAAASAPELATHADALRATFDTLGGTTLDVQRVHGDFHLGQTLAVQGEGEASGVAWTIIDFEGEPAKTAAERRALDAPLRDLAGMVRSFDYARSAHAEPASAQAIGWSDAARAAFLDGYGGDVDEPLLTAYVIDKAIYEVMYELRNRPTWVGIPLRAIESAVATRL